MLEYMDANSIGVLRARYPEIPKDAAAVLLIEQELDSGTYAVVVQLDNSADSPELPVQTGTFSGVINFQPPLPLGFVSGGTFTIDGMPGATFPFNAVFRQPFRNNEKAGVVTQRGRNVTDSKTDSKARFDAAYYLLDNGELQEVRPDERAVGWPTVRFEITF